MLYFYYGTDREKARAALEARARKLAKGGRILRLGDASPLADLSAALGGGGMFDKPGRVIALEYALENDEARAIVLAVLPRLADSPDYFFVLEEKPEAAARRAIEERAAEAKRFDAPAKKRAGAFDLAHALKRGDKKALWTGLMREFAADAVPEALHGILFWGAKDMFLKTRGNAEKKRAAALVASLAELPHEARRRGEELEYALERFALSGA